MTKEDVIKALKEIADLLEITDASRFEFMAFRNAASAVDDFEGDLTAAVAEQTITEIPAIGKGTAKVITQLVESGDADELTRVRGLVPDDLPALLRFRGLGPKRVRALWKEAEVESPEDLEKAIQDGRIAKLKGFGAKTIETMLASIDYFRNSSASSKPLPKLDKVPQAIASSGKVFAGTSGYSYPQWKGGFFPDKAKTDDLLKHYADKLNSVEINNTFYRFPSEKVVQQWKTLTPDSFQFSLKAHRRVTHQMRLSAATTIRIQEFVERCSVLGTRLGCILFQLPPDFERNDERLNNLLNAIPDGPRYAVEFRHASWNDETVFDMLRSKNVACVAGDAEDQEPEQYATADFLYVRLRKPEYSEAELNSWNTWFQQHQADGRDVLVYLKHDDTGTAPTNTAKLWNS